MKTKTESNLTWGTEPLWKGHAGAAAVDLNAAITTPGGAPDELVHLLDARSNIDKAIDALRRKWNDRI